MCGYGIYTEFWNKELLFSVKVEIKSGEYVAEGLAKFVPWSKSVKLLPLVIADGDDASVVEVVFEWMNKWNAYISQQ